MMRGAPRPTPMYRVGYNDPVSELEDWGMSV